MFVENRKDMKHKQGTSSLRNWHVQRDIIARLMINAVRCYQRVISSQRPACCRYYPTCSRYAIEAVERYGAFRGGILAVLRLLRCTPWSNGGIDDVPRRYSIFYRYAWSQAHEEPRLTPLASQDKETNDV